MNTPDDLTIATLDLSDDSSANDARLRAWASAVCRGFHEPRMDDETHRVWLDYSRVDGSRLRGAWVTAPAVGSGSHPVATFTSFDKTLDVDGSLLPLRMITDVTVSPTHRRRGLLRTLMAENLAEAVEQGLPVAALTASEGSIYGRFGFGLATHTRHVEVDTGPRFALRDQAEHAHTGSVVLLHPEEAWPSVSDVFDRFHARTHGSVARPHFYRSILTGSFDWEHRTPDRKLQTALVVSEDGAPEGYVAYRHVGREESRATVEVVDLVALTAPAYLRLWRFLADLDLVERVRWRRAPVEDPLAWALVDPFVVRTTRVDDLLWVRVLDVPTALAARRWGADGEVVLDVDDPLGHADGRFRVTTRGGHAEVARTDDAPGAQLTADTLATLLMRSVPPATLRAAGRLHGDPAALDRLDAMAAGGPAPYCMTAF